MYLGAICFNNNTRVSKYAHKYYIKYYVIQGILYYNIQAYLNFTLNIFTFKVSVLFLVSIYNRYEHEISQK